MIILIIIGVCFFSQNHNTLPDIKAFIPFTGKGNNIALISIVMFSLMGLEMSAVHAKEVKNPQKNFPRALKISGSIITLTLILATMAIVVIVPPSQLKVIGGMDNAFYLFFAKTGISWMLPIVILMIIFEIIINTFFHNNLSSFGRNR